MAKMITVDARGDQCPIPVVKAKQALGQLPEGGLVRVLVDNEIAVQNLTKLGRHQSMEVQSRKLKDKEFEVVIASDKAMVPQPELEAETCMPDARGDTVVAVGSAVMGNGDDQLGAVLMKGFLYALSQMDRLPDTILFYNGGARLTTEGSQSLEDLRNLEAQGVKIRTCGTCLDFYRLKEKLQVGEVTNMYEIAETLAAAGKVIRP